jgi:hypothetical protein
VVPRTKNSTGLQWVCAKATRRKFGLHGQHAERPSSPDGTDFLRRRFRSPEGFAHAGSYPVGVMSECNGFGLLGAVSGAMDVFGLAGANLI